MERARRLRKGDEFDTAYREGIAVGGPLLVVRHRPNGMEQTRWGFAVGKKMAKRAVQRNRLRRQLREAARSLPVQSGRDIIITTRPASLGKRYPELMAALQRGLKRAGLLEDQPER